MTARTKPDFIIIGAVKGATTWSARALAARADVFIPGPEPHYFSTNFDKGPDWYAARFAGAGDKAVIGEKSADYLAHPDAAARMAADVPGARLIVQLRNPVERAYSDYCMLFRRGTVKEAPGAYFSSRARSVKGERFLNGGLYAEHLARFYDHFAREQILVLLYEDIMTAPMQAFNRILAHVGLPSDATEISAERKNDSAAPLLPLTMRKALRPFKAAVRPFRGMSWFEALRAPLARKVDYPPLDDSAQAFLGDFYRKDIMALESMIGRKLDQWRAPDHSSKQAAPFSLQAVRA